MEKYKGLHKIWSLEEAENFIRDSENPYAYEYFFSEEYDEDKIENKNVNTIITKIIEKDKEIKHQEEAYYQSLNKADIVKKIEILKDERNEIKQLYYLLERIHPMTINTLLKYNHQLINIFFKKEIIEMTVMSIDLRKSTELMLKAVSPDDYAEFITGLTNGLKDIILDNYGVFDKFTGDGILSYFPVFFSGNDCILNCCLTAQKCHEFFNEYYKKHYDKFSVLLETGLGIGVDHGMVKTVSLNKEITIVGSPVVYACRLSGAPANRTYLNRKAFCEISKYGIKAVELIMDIKNEGKIVVYALEKINNRKILIPQWLKEVNNYEGTKTSKN